MNLAVRGRIITAGVVSVKIFTKHQSFWSVTLLNFERATGRNRKGSNVESLTTGVRSGLGMRSLGERSMSAPYQCAGLYKENLDCVQEKIQIVISTTYSQGNIRFS